jgi:hypothetical protein
MGMSMNAKLKTARRNFDTSLAEVLSARPDLTHREIEKEFGVSETVIRRVIKQFAIPPRKRGPKAKEAING